MLLARRLIWTVVGAMLLGCGSSGWAQDAAYPQGSDPDAAAPLTFRGGVDFVQLDVFVTGDGPAAVADLTREDFEVFEDGQRQTLEQFELIRATGIADPTLTQPLTIRTTDDARQEASRRDTRVFIFFLDDYHTDFAHAVIARNEIAEFIETGVGQNDLLAVMGPLTPVDSVELTRDHASVVRQVLQFEGRRFRYEPRNLFEEQYARYSAQTIESIRNQVVISALAGLSTHLGTIRDSRTAIIYVSEGMTASVPPGVTNMMAEGTGGGTLSGSSRIFALGDLYDRLREIYEAANRNNASIYPVDPRGLSGAGLNMGQQVSGEEARSYLNEARSLLRTLAERTDGRAIVNRNDLADGLKQVVQDSSVYYLLGFTSMAPTDGEFHEVDVRVRRPGVSVRARRGYWAASPADAVLAAAPPAERPSRAIEEALAGIQMPVRAARFVRTWVGAEVGAAGRTRMRFVWEGLPGVPGVERERAAQLTVIGIAADGRLLFRERVPETTEVATGPFQLLFDAEPGTVELDISIEDAGGIRIDSEVQALDVPDFSAVGPTVTTPRVYRARNAREWQAIAGDANAVPTPARVFPRSERLLIRFDVVNTSTDAPAPVAALLNRTGQRVRDVPVSTASAGGDYQIDLGLGGVPSGEYLIEISLAGAEEAVLVGIRIEGQDALRGSRQAQERADGQERVGLSEPRAQ